MNVPDILASLVAGEDLSDARMTSLMQAIMTGEATSAQVGSALTALRIKGETVTEIAAAAKVMRALAARVNVDPVGLVDTCGTGGSGSNKFNVSTASAFVAAGAGLKVAKHGNRAASGNSGSADVLESAGVYLDLTPAQVAQCIDVVGLGFLFAVNHHGAMRHARHLHHGDGRSEQGAKKQTTLGVVWRVASACTSSHGSQVPEERPPPQHPPSRPLSLPPAPV